MPFFSLFSLELLILWAPLFMRQTNILTKAPSTMVPLKLLNLVGSSALSPFFLLPLESRFLSFLVYGFMVKSNNCPRYLFICHHSIINFMHSTILPCIFDATNCCWNVIIIYEAVHPVLKKKKFWQRMYFYCNRRKVIPQKHVLLQIQYNHILLQQLCSYNDSDIFSFSFRGCRKLRRLQRWKLVQELQMPQWTNGFRCVVYDTLLSLGKYSFSTFVLRSFPL